MTVKDIVIYTDGAAEPNPGPGGYGVVLQYGEHRKELSDGFEKTTNNRMELMGVIAGLEALTKKCSGTLYSDSKYVVDAVNLGWIIRWQENDWYRNRKREVKNIDLWERFLEIYEKHDIKLVWVKGHAGIAENECCDQLAVAATKADNLKPDVGYVECDKPILPKIQPAKREPKIKHKNEGEPCRKCQTPLIKRTTKRKKRKAGQTYYFKWILCCPNCRSIYMVEEAKCFIDADGEDLGGKDIDSNGSLF